MVLRILVYCSLIIYTVGSRGSKLQTCVTGYMTDVQTWVDGKGVLTSEIDYHEAIDLSANSNPVPILQQKIMVMTDTRTEYNVRYLSLARCRLNRVPTVFQFRDSQDRDLAEVLEYVTFYGNSFQDVSSPGEEYDVIMNATQAREVTNTNLGIRMQSNTVWSTGFKETYFPKLKELDLRNCAIQILNGNVFTGMPSLEALYLGENGITYIDTDAFVGLGNLIHLDMSLNSAQDESGNVQSITMEPWHIFEPLYNLKSLDFSSTKLLQRQIVFLKSLSQNLTRLSLCDTGLGSLDDDVFNHTSLRILDVSSNNGILSRSNVLRGLENTLEVLYGKDIGLKTVNIFYGFSQLKILELSINEINAMTVDVARTLTDLNVMNLNKNRISSWFGKVFSQIPNLQLLSLKENNINVISEEMIKDMAPINYVALSGNFIVCNCYTRDFFDLALRNEQIPQKTENRISGRMELGPPIETYHSGIRDFNKLIYLREPVFINCTEEEQCVDDLHEDMKGNFLLLDFHPSTYMCLQVPESVSLEFSEVVGCNRSSRDINYDKVMAESRNMLYMLLSIPILLLIMGFGFVFRRNVRYFYITMRNSALLSIINKNDVLDEGAIFHYDVFVSYCNEDRNWVLDHLLPHLETECSISACLHERDFQVGHSILENIVSCMDRSRSIMLILSQRFLLSQWCQFEMHLAQHRLLETRREDLTLVLLEDIPRRLRPNTLHYLMLTKTYIVWPKDENERIMFWKRLKKTLISIKMKHTAGEGVSLA